MKIDLTVEITDDEASLIAEALGMPMIDPITGDLVEDIEQKMEAFIEHDLYQDTLQKYEKIVRQIWAVEVNPDSSLTATPQQENDVKEVLDGMVSTRIRAA